MDGWDYLATAAAAGVGVAVLGRLALVVREWQRLLALGIPDPTPPSEAPTPVLPIQAPKPCDMPSRETMDTALARVGDVHRWSMRILEDLEECRRILRDLHSALPGNKPRPPSARW